MVDCAPVGSHAGQEDKMAHPKVITITDRSTKSRILIKLELSLTWDSKGFAHIIRLSP